MLKISAPIWLHSPFPLKLKNKKSQGLKKNSFINWWMRLIFTYLTLGRPMRAIKFRSATKVGKSKNLTFTRKCTGNFLSRMTKLPPPPPPPHKHPKIFVNTRFNF